MALITERLLSNFATQLAEKIAEIFAKKADIPSSLPANGGNADTVNDHTVGADVPSGAEFTDTVYTHPTSSGSRHIPAGGASGQILRWASDGTAQWDDDGSAAYEPMTGATASAAGTSGLVPAPAKGTADRYLRSDGAWAQIQEAKEADIDDIINGLFE